ncbi:MAG TPA: glycosyltransferase family 39 protein [Thermoleophilaceae bacterium]|nr:glycosyltransferase family 39 protein [Thermoleophilaceae bacterium]
MPRRRVALVLLACTLVAATGVRVAAGADKRGLTHDEAISYLAAACHQGDYARLTLEGRRPVGRWVPASEWKVFLTPERALCLGTIARDLAREDIHPPLYFWLLHGWGLVFGVGLWTGVSLNIGLAALTTIALFGLARRVLGDPLRAAGVAFVWSFSPAAIRVFAEARQYELLALLATLFVWQCVRVADPATRPRARELLALAAITAAGALSQFLFGMVAVAGLALVLVRRWRGRRGVAAGALAAVAAGYGAFALLHPGFTDALARGRAQATEPSLDRLDGRVELVARMLAEFVLPPGAAQGSLALVGTALVVAATALALAPGQPRRGEKDARPGDGRAMVLVFVWLTAANAALFLAFVSPSSAMDFKHVSTLWPFAAFVPVLAVGRVPRRARTPVAIAGAAALAAAGSVAALGQGPGAGPAPALERARGVVLDNVARGVLLRVVWRVPDAARVFAAQQHRLLDRPDAWLPELEPGDVFVGGLPASDPRYGNSPLLARRVAAELRRRHRVVPVADPLERGHVFRVGAAVDRP